MTTDQLTYTGSLVATSCGVCHIRFAIPEGMERRARDDDDIWFWCPSGHKLHYTGPSEATKLKAQLDQTKAEVRYQEKLRREAAQRAQEADARTAAARAEVARTRKRAANGVCPCCNRSFTALARHMKAKHPDFMVMEEVPAGFNLWPLMRAVEMVVVQADEPLRPDAVLGRLVLAGRRNDTERSVANALYNAEYRNGLIFRTAPKTWSAP